MSALTEPEVGLWYQDVEGRTFEVVAIDAGDIAVQYFDGEVEEIDREIWDVLRLKPAEEPRDWTGPFDGLEFNELGEVDFRKDQLQSYELLEEM